MFARPAFIGDGCFSLFQTDASRVEIVHNHYISAIAYEPQIKSLPNMNAFRLPVDGACRSWCCLCLGGGREEPLESPESYGAPALKCDPRHNARRVTVLHVIFPAVSQHPTLQPSTALH
jgi:hypothetical protein